MKNPALEQAREALALMNGEDHERAKGHAILVRIKREIAKSYVREHDDHEAMRTQIAEVAATLETVGQSARGGTDIDLATGSGLLIAAARLRDALAGGAS